MMGGIAQGHMAYQQELAAKQAMERDVYSSSDQPRQIIMGAVSRAVEMQGNRIGDVLGTVTLFLDRFFGPQPEPSASAGAPTPQPTGVIHEVERNLSRNDRLLCELEERIRRLGDIA